MRAEISVIVPTLNAEASLPDCFQSLMEGLPEGLIREVIVGDGGSTDATADIAEAAGAVLVVSSPSRGGQLRRAVEVAQGRWLLVLHADTVLQPGWSRVVAGHIATSSEAACFRLDFATTGFGPAWVAGWANFRTRLFGLPFGDQGLLLRRQDYDRAGGYPDQPLMEDMALVRSLPRGPVVLPVRALTSAARFQRMGWFRAGAGNLGRQIRYLAGADPNSLVRGYKR